MESETFKRQVKKPVCEYLSHSGIRTSKKVDWSAREEADGLVIVGTVKAHLLCDNLQEDWAATPAFAFCFAYWLERALGRPVRCTVNIEGNPPPKDSPEHGHWMRSQFLLEGFAHALGDRIQIEPAPTWRWPKAPVINAPQKKRSDDSRGTHPRSEHSLERTISGSGDFARSFAAAGFDAVPFRPQLPIGLFETPEPGEKRPYTSQTRWTIGGASQVDLWSHSTDGEVFHLLELKAFRRSGKPNAKVGIIPEAFYYARLLHFVRTGLPDGRPIRGEGPGLAAVRDSKRIIGWLVAPTLHPLVYSEAHRQSPLEWINRGTAPHGLELRILPFDVDERANITLRPRDSWPSVHADDTPR